MSALTSLWKFQSQQLVVLLLFLYTKTEVTVSCFLFWSMFQNISCLVLFPSLLCHQEQCVLESFIEPLKYTDFIVISVSQYNILSNDMKNRLQNIYFIGLCIQIYRHVCTYIYRPLFHNKISTNTNIGHTKRQIISHFFVSRINKSAVLASDADTACYLLIAMQAKTTVSQDKSTLDKRISQYLQNCISSSNSSGWRRQHAKKEFSKDVRYAKTSADSTIFFPVVTCINSAKHILVFKGKSRVESYSTLSSKYITH